jgi:Skp family chaperone for outer membrane proteins
MMMAALLIAGATARGQAAEVKIAYVDLAKVMAGYEKAEVLQEEFGGYRSTLRRDEEERLQALRKLQEEIRQLARGTPERLELEKTLQVDYLELQRLQEENARSLERRFGRMRAEILSDIVRQVTVIAEREDYDLVLERVAAPTPGQTELGPQRLVLFAKEKYDISADIITALNAAEPWDGEDGGGPTEIPAD